MAIETKEITNSDDVIDVRDVIARVEQLEELPERDADSEDEDEYEPEREELVRLTALLDELRGNGGDEEWRTGQ